MSKRRPYSRMTGVIFWACLGIFSACAHADDLEDYPDQSIRIVVPFPPGGSTDSIARILAEGMSRELGTPVYIDNRPGASTNIGSESVVKARPDGYTLLMGGSTSIANTIFGPKPNFEPREALAPISTVAEVSFVLATNPDAPFTKPSEFLDAVRSEPGKFSVASAQLDTYVEHLKLAASVDILHVPYKGGAYAVTDVMSGQVDSAFALVPVLLPQIKAGKLRAIAVSSSKRLSMTLPDVPTFAESGVDFVSTIWYGLQAPAGLIPERMNKLNKAVRSVVDAPDFAGRLAELGASAGGSSAAAMTQLLDRQQSAWQELARKYPELLQAGK
ncbi:tripartite tricarboxylate transporter substrate binding protein [Diaphorobacter ruginosibacter]|uniref:tripartite tricarboxylate transporter substrate binding protein n=1 Tax=Diaphorobacter ruginosibacter TaxID=1715720 RepID=UPI00333F8A24